MQIKHLGKSTLAFLLSCTLAITLFPAYSFADEEETADPEIIAIDKAEAYVESPDASNDVYAQASGMQPMTLSKEMLYFAAYESGQNYDQGFSSGDGYNALGYFQFDRRYGLQAFLISCYNYNPSTYSMFKFLKEGSIDISQGSMYDARAGKLTSMGKRVEDAWHAAYKKNRTEFSRLQNYWAYTKYYIPAENYMESRGISIKDRSDCVRGLLWGMSNLFGTDGMKRFVGGTMYDGKTYAGAGLKSSMNDFVFVDTLCKYLVNNIERLLPSSSSYWQGYKNRYNAERKTCLSYLYPKDVNRSEWYYTSGAIEFVFTKGLMSGYASNGLFAPFDVITRGEVATILYRYSNPNSTDTTKKADYAKSSQFKDVKGGQFYTAAINWCQKNKVITGYEDVPGKGVYSSFQPDKKVTREELATMIWRYSVSIRGASTAGVSNAKLKPLLGSESASPWAKEGLEWCTSKGVLSGIDNHNATFSLDPQGNAWRASMAKMIMKASSTFKR